MITGAQISKQPHVKYEGSEKEPQHQLEKNRGTRVHQTQLLARPLCRMPFALQKDEFPRF